MELVVCNRLSITGLSGETLMVPTVHSWNGLILQCEEALFQKRRVRNIHIFTGTSFPPHLANSQYMSVFSSARENLPEA